MKFATDKIILQPGDIDLSYSPLKDLKAETYVLGAFNPGLNKLPNGNLIMMVRVAEALKEPVKDKKVRQIRYTEKNYVMDMFDAEKVNTSDPRKFVLKQRNRVDVHILTSLSWILPVELSPDGTEIVKIHYDKIISSSQPYQEYGVEDARLSRIEGKYYMTSCSVSAQRLCTTLYTSTDGLNYRLEGIVLDHQNKDMLLFEGKIKGQFYALTRPLGGLYFSYPNGSEYLPGPSINLAVSPDGLHWKPTENVLIRGKKNTSSTEKVGGGSQPVLTSEGWLMLYHGVERTQNVGIYRTFWALLDKNNPHKIKAIEDKKALLEAKPSLTQHLKSQIYLNNIVFTTGIVEKDDFFVVASGELDLCCRITHIGKEGFFLNGIRE